MSKEQYEFFKSFKEKALACLNSIPDSKKFKYLKEADIKFFKGWERSKSLLASLQESLDKDYAIGHTSLGPHRMDCEYYINGKMASSILSRGQSKLLIILIFLINHNLINSFIESETILLVDDLASELDLENLEFVLEEISKTPSQVILTGIEGDDLEKIVTKFSNFKRINL